MSDEKSNKILNILILISIFLILVPYAGENDFWFHLRTGETIVESGIFPRTDIFSYTAEGSKWVNHEWPSQILFYITYKYLGFDGVSALVAVMGVIFFGLFLSRIKNPSIIHYLMLWLSAYALQSFFVPRPQIFAYVFLLMLVLTVEKYREIKDKKYLILLSGIVLLWANFHASVILAPIVLAFYGFGSITKPDKKFLTVSLAAIVLSLLNPFTYKVYAYAFQPLRHFDTYHTILETLPVFRNLNLPGISTAFVLHLIFGLLFLTLVLRKRRPPSQIHNYERLLFMLFFILPFASTKYIPFSWAVIIPVAVKLMPNPAFSFNNLAKKATVTSLIIFSSAVFLTNNNFARSIHTEWPQAGIEFIKNLRGNLFNSYSLGGYIMWQNKNQKVFVDGRFEMFADEQYTESFEFEGAENVDMIINKYDLSVVVTSFARPLSYTLSSKPDWALVYWDNFVVVFIKKDGKNSHIIKEYELNLKYLNDSIEGVLKKYKPSEWPSLIENYKEAIMRQPDLRMARYRLGLFYEVFGQCDKAIKEWQEVIKIDDTLGSAHLKLAECYGKLGESELAKKEKDLGLKYSKDQKWLLGRNNNFRINLK